MPLKSTQNKLLENGIPTLACVSVTSLYMYANAHKDKVNYITYSNIIIGS